MGLFKWYWERRRKKAIADTWRMLQEFFETYKSDYGPLDHYLKFGQVIHKYIAEGHHKVVIKKKIEGAGKGVRGLEMMYAGAKERDMEHTKDVLAEYGQLDRLAEIEKYNDFQDKIHKHIIRLRHAFNRAKHAFEHDHLDELQKQADEYVLEIEKIIHFRDHYLK